MTERAAYLRDAVAALDKLKSQLQTSILWPHRQDQEKKAE